MQVFPKKSVDFLSYWNHQRNPPRCQDTKHGPSGGVVWRRCRGELGLRAPRLRVGAAGMAGHREAVAAYCLRAACFHEEKDGWKWWFYHGCNWDVYIECNIYIYIMYINIDHCIYIYTYYIIYICTYYIILYIPCFFYLFLCMHNRIWACDHQTSGLFNKRWSITPTILGYSGIDLDVGGYLNCSHLAGKVMTACFWCTYFKTDPYICVCVCLCR